MTDGRGRRHIIDALGVKVFEAELRALAQLVVIGFPAGVMIVKFENLTIRSGNLIRAPLAIVADLQSHGYSRWRAPAKRLAVLRDRRINGRAVLRPRDETNSDIARRTAV